MCLEPFDPPEPGAQLDRPAPFDVAACEHDMRTALRMVRDEP